MPAMADLPLRHRLPAPALLPALLLALLLALLAGSGWPCARADELSQVRGLQHAGHLQQALQAVRRLIAQHPDDPRLRLSEALILQQQHRDDQAIEVLRQLTLKYPELPEPYNNLAVLYAARGQQRLALQQLRMALHANPEYATAASNLGDVYLRLAEQAYAQALQGSDDAAAQAHARDMLRGLRQLQPQAGGAPPAR